MSDTPTRCSGCGKPIEDGDDTKRIADGKMKEGEFAEKKEWAVMHRSCFNRSIDSPTAAFDELKKQAELKKKAGLRKQAVRKKHAGGTKKPAVKGSSKPKAISWRPPYPTATFRMRTVCPADRSMALIASLYA